MTTTNNQKNKFFIASDHAGVELKAELIHRLKKEWSFEDLGTHSSDSTDYPTFAEKVTDSILKNPGSLGVLICGTGIGMSIAANKVHGIRAACVSEERSARLAREHNDAQILCIGARILAVAEAEKCIREFLQSEFDRSHPRHERRVELMREIEERQCL